MKINNMSDVDEWRRSTFRVRTVVENLEKSWDFKMVISRPGKVMGTT